MSEPESTPETPFTFNAAFDGDLTFNNAAANIMACRIAHGFETTKENMLGKLMLVVTEVAEAAEDVRHERWDHFAEEIADAMIRLLDISSALGIDIEAAMHEKMAANWKRERLHGTKVTT